MAAARREDDVQAVLDNALVGMQYVSCVFYLSLSLSLLLFLLSACVLPSTLVLAAKSRVVIRKSSVVLFVVCHRYQLSQASVDTNLMRGTHCCQFVLHIALFFANFFVWWLHRKDWTECPGLVKFVFGFAMCLLALVLFMGARTYALYRDNQNATLSKAWQGVELAVHLTVVITACYCVAGTPCVCVCMIMWRSCIWCARCRVSGQVERHVCADICGISPGVV
jgi:hypothetical protein